MAWDGPPQDETNDPDKPHIIREPQPPFEVGDDEDEDGGYREMVRIKLADGKEREIQHMMTTLYLGADGVPVTAAKFIQTLFGTLVTFSAEKDLRRLWSNPITRAAFLQELADVGFGVTALKTVQTLIDAQQSDLFDVLEYVAFARPPITRIQRADQVRSHIFSLLNEEEQAFLDFVLTQYIQVGVTELMIEKLPPLLEIKYETLQDAQQRLGSIKQIRQTFNEFQQHLYAD